MSVRDRVVRAMELPVAEADKLLAEAESADDHTRLSILLTGWFRGVAAGIEELAVELDAQKARTEEPFTPIAPAEPPAEEREREPEPEPRAEHGGTERELADVARRSREATEDLRAATGVGEAPDEPWAKTSSGDADDG